ncbi:MAG: PspC domain-containing protein [Bacillota bacterium]
MEVRKKLYRSIDERIVGGVCGGVAEYFKVDPVLIRIIFILLFFGAGTGLLAYLIAWIIVPEEPR